MSQTSDAVSNSQAEKFNVRKSFAGELLTLYLEGKSTPGKRYTGTTEERYSRTRGVLPQQPLF